MNWYDRVAGWIDQRLDEGVKLAPAYKSDEFEVGAYSTNVYICGGVMVGWNDAVAWREFFLELASVLGYEFEQMPNDQDIRSAALILLAEWRKRQSPEYNPALNALKQRYQSDRDLFTDKEIERLRFWRDYMVPVGNLVAT